MQTIAKTHRAYRYAQAAISLNLPNVDVRLRDGRAIVAPQKASASREMVEEFMILAGRAIAQFATEHDIPMPYVTQDTGDFSDEILANQSALTLSQSFKAIKGFKRSRISTTPKLHAGLGLPAYIRITSPLRRYLDLVAHQQLLSFIQHQPEALLDTEQMKARIGQVNILMRDIGKTNKASAEHFKCLYLRQNPTWQGRAVVVDRRGDKALLMMPEIGMMTQIKLNAKHQCDDEIMLKVGRVDLINRLANFQPV